MNISNSTIRWIKRILATAFVVVLFAAIQGGAEAPHGRDVLLIYDQADPALAWNGISNATYRVEQRTNLLTGAWNTRDPWRAPFSDLVTWPITEPDLPSQFFRVQFPTPELTGSEPTFVPEAGGTTIYVTGNYFYEGDQIRVDGVLLTNVVFLSHNLMSGELPDLAPGLHRVVLSGHSGGWSVVLPDALEVSPPFERTVQGPPEWPLAGPAPALDWRGHQTVLKSQSGGGDDDDGPTDCDDADISSRRAGTDDDGLLDICLFSGEVRQQVVDLVIPGRGLDFVWGRTYRARACTAVVGATCSRWTHSYDVRCVQNSGGTMDVYDGSGRKDVFRLQANGTYACPEFFREGTLDPATGTFRLTFADTGYWEFVPLGASPASGKLVRVVDRYGNTVSLAYDGAGRLSAIVDDLQRTHTMAYSPNGQLASITDCFERTVTYQYYGQGEAGGALGDLKSVTSPSVTGTPNNNDFPGGKTITYTYSSGFANDAENHLLLSVIDGKGETVCQFTYEHDPSNLAFLRCISAQDSTNVPARFTYLPVAPTPENRFRTLTATCNDPLGNVCELSFDGRNRCVLQREFTGRATPGLPVTAQANRPANPLRPTDPAYYDTHWSWNQDSLCVQKIEPLGNSVVCVYEREINPAASPRKKGDLRELAYKDGEGNEMRTRFAYDPRFGSPAQSYRKGWDGSVKGISALRKGWDGSVKGSSALRKGWDGSVKGSSALRKGWDGSVKGNIAERKGWDGSVKGRLAARVSTAQQKSKVVVRGWDMTKKEQRYDNRDNDCDGFVTRVVNPRGFEARCEYDAHGNPTALTQHGSSGSGEAPPVLAREDFEYNEHGQLTAYVHAEDAQGIRRRDTCVYYETGPQAGRLSSIAIDESGVHLTTAFEHDPRGNCTRVVDPRGTDTLFIYNALDQCVGKQTQGTTFGEKVNQGLSYDANNRLIQIDTDNRDETGALDPLNPQWTTTFEYDVLNQLTQIAHELTHIAQQLVMTNQFVYDANGNITLLRLPEAVSTSDPDNTVAYAYDERGLLFIEERAPGSGLSTKDQFDYDGNGNLARVNKVDGFTIKQSVFRYDGFDRCVQAIDAMGNSTLQAFDANGNLTYTRVDGETTDQPGGKGNRKLAETTYTYDPLDRLTHQAISFFDIFTEIAIGDGASETSWAYAPNGQPMSVTDDNGQLTRYGYDGAGRLASVTDPKGNVTDCTFDANGNVLTVTRADLSDVSAGEQHFMSTFVYDPLNRCVSACDTVGNTVSNAYGSCGNVVRATDAAGNATVRVYDGLGRVIDTTQYEGSKERGITINTSHNEYRNSRLVSMTDGNGNTTAYSYDACDRCVAVDCADGTTESLVWNPSGTLAQSTDANGTVVGNTYDLCDRLVSCDIVPAAGVMETTTFETFAYDGLGRLVAASNDGSSLTRTYDSLGNQTSSTQDGLASASTYDGEGNRLSLAYPSGRILYSAYGALNQITNISTRASVQGGLSNLATFAYDGATRLAKTTRANNINTRIFWNGIQGQARADNDYGEQQVARINHSLAGGGLVVDQRVCAYDRNQNKTLLTMTAPWLSGTMTTVVSGYDGSHRLTRGTMSGSVHDYTHDYVYDPNGNRLQVTNNASLQSYEMDATTPVPADRQADQYTSTPFGREWHDDNGNLIQSRTSSSVTRNCIYDYADRLVFVYDLRNGMFSPVASYSYDVLGRRIAKTIYPGGSLPVETYYVYDGDNDCDGILETRAGGPSGSVDRVYCWENAFTASSPLASFDVLGALQYFYHCDELGNVLALTGASGNVVEHYDYDDFGLPLFFNGYGEPLVDSNGQPMTQSSAGNPFLFHGMEWDGLTGLYIEGSPKTPARFYTPKTGRYTSRSDGSCAFAENNPCSLKKEEDGRHTPFQNNTRRRPGRTKYSNISLLGGAIPGGAVISAAVSSVGQLGGGGGGASAAAYAATGRLSMSGTPAMVTRVQDYNSSRSNKTSSRIEPGGGGAFSLIVPVAMDKGLRFKTKHDTVKNSINNVR